jgi:hypothetical protein
MEEINAILNASLNRNTAKMVIDFITEPPKLPFIDELKTETQYIYQDTIRFVFYKLKCISYSGYVSGHIYTYEIESHVVYFRSGNCIGWNACDAVSNWETIKYGVKNYF